MIEFRLNANSGVSPYQQIVQQVKSALRLGRLRVGDQLPTVKEVVGKIAINPNTVLKAYRELEHDGLVAARPGIGTFIVNSFDDTTYAAQRTLRRSLEVWIEKARRAGLDDESIEALFVDTFLFAPKRSSRMTSALHATDLGKRYGRKWALSNCTLDIPTGHVVGLVGPNGAGKTTLLHLAVGLLTPEQRHASTCWARSGDERRTTRSHRLRRAEHPGVRKPLDRNAPRHGCGTQSELGRAAGESANARPRA